MKNRYSVILGNTCDRFLPTGYKDVVLMREMIHQAASIPGIRGIELVGSWHITETNFREVFGSLQESGLKCVSIITDLFSKKRCGNAANTLNFPTLGVVPPYSAS
jgi:hypothetical protein